MSDTLSEAFKELEAVQATIEKLRPASPANIVTVLMNMPDEHLLQLRNQINQILASRGLGGLAEGLEVLQ